MFLTTLTLATLLSTADAISTIIKHDFDELSQQLLEEAPLSPISDPQKTPITFTIHARTTHHSVAGSAVSVWITPGMSADSPVTETCKEEDGPACYGDQADKIVVRRLFTRALNSALAENERGLGHYEVTKCGEPPKTKDRGWLGLLAKVPIAVDLRHNYSLAKPEDARTTGLTQYAIAALRIRPPGAIFGPLPGKKRVEGLEQLWTACKANTLHQWVLVTQLRLNQLREEKVAPPAPKS